MEDEGWGIKRKDGVGPALRADLGFNGRRRVALGRVMTTS